MFNGRNCTFFPNMQLAGGWSSQLRVICPISPNRTEMHSYCLAPVGESPESRAQRLRQYEDFYNPTGLASPDDNAVYENCQIGNNSDLANWHQGYMRGIALPQQNTKSRPARELGINPVAFTEAPYLLQNETIFHGLYREWLRLLKKNQPASPLSSASHER
jgi:hypothetical protein